MGHILAFLPGESSSLAKPDNMFGISLNFQERAHVRIWGCFVHQSALVLFRFDS